MLSDGYKRLVNIVTDLAIRCALLNKTLYGADAYKHTHGTVIIDEIDEHLHPALQSKVLRALHSTFPEVQFIASTHAPLVMSSVEKSDDNVVYRLLYNAEERAYSHMELNTYGLDSNLILEEGLMVGSRDPIVDERIKQIEKFVSERKLKEAESLLADLETNTDPSQPALIKIHSIINRLQSRLR